jgi:hypothetical protein
MAVYQRATKKVLPEQRFEVWQLYIKRAAALRGPTYARELYEAAISDDLLADREVGRSRKRKERAARKLGKENVDVVIVMSLFSPSCTVPPHLFRLRNSPCNLPHWRPTSAKLIAPVQSMHTPLKCATPERTRSSGRPGTTLRYVRWSLVCDRHGDMVVHCWPLSCSLTRSANASHPGPPRQRRHLP